MSDIVTGSTAMALELTALRAENERLKIENIQMQAALGYGILADDERHILPSNPFKCGTCDASKHLRAEVERLTEELSIWMSVFPDIAPQSVLPDRSKLEADNERLRAALEKMQRSRDRYRQAWEAEKARARAALTKGERTPSFGDFVEGCDYLPVPSTKGESHD